MNNSPPNIFLILLLFERYHQNCWAVLAAAGMNGLRERKCADEGYGQLVFSREVNHFSQVAISCNIYMHTVKKFSCPHKHHTM